MEFVKMDALSLTAPEVRAAEQTTQPEPYRTPTLTEEPFTMSITVRVGRLPGTITEIALEEGATIRQAVEQAGLDVSDHEVRRNSVTVGNLNDRVAQGDTILLVKKIKGNAVTVRVGRLPGTISEVALEEGATIRQAVEQAGLDVSDHEVRRNSVTVTNLNERIAQGDTILLVKKIKGNAVTVRVGRLPGTISEVALDEGATIRQAVEQAGLDVSDHEVRRNSVTVTNLNERVAQGDTILLVKKIKGNS